MDFVVLDTDVASQSFRQRLTGPLADQLARPTWAVTFVTEGELWKWAALYNWGPLYVRRLESWLSRVIVLSVGESVARRWGDMTAAARRRGRTPPTNDSWIGQLPRARPAAGHLEREGLPRPRRSRRSDPAQLRPVPKP